MPYQIAKLGERHKTMAAFMLANPHLDYIAVAEALGWTKEWVGMVVRSDMFKAHLSQLRAEMHQAVNHKIVHELGQMTARSLGRIRERLEAGAISNRELIETADLGLRNMGYGQSRSAQPSGPQLHLHVSSEDIRSASERIGARAAFRTIEGAAGPGAGAGPQEAAGDPADAGGGDERWAEPAQQRPGEPVPGPGAGPP